jgi:hypothetical protein
MIKGSPPYLGDLRQARFHQSGCAGADLDQRMSMAPRNSPGMKPVALSLG